MENMGLSSLERKLISLLKSFNVDRFDIIGIMKVLEGKEQNQGELLHFLEGLENKPMEMDAMMYRVEEIVNR